jgi:hypothetical protein
MKLKKQMRVDNPILMDTECEIGFWGVVMLRRHVIGSYVYSPRAVYSGSGYV